LQNICRGATISGGAEMYGRRVINMLSGVEDHAVSSTSRDNYTGSDRLSAALILTPYPPCMMVMFNQGGYDQNMI